MAAALQFKSHMEKRFKIFTGCLMLLISWSAWADLNNLTIQGDLRIRAEDANKTDFVSNRAGTLFRLRPLLTWKPNEETTVVLQLQAAKTMGEPSYTPASATSNSQQQTSGASSNGDTPVTFHQAYGIYAPMANAQLIAGRQVLSYGNELSVGEADWNNISRSFDAIHFRGTYHLGWTDIFTAKIVDANTTSAGPGDKDFHGIYNGWNFGSYLNQLDFYFFNLHDSTVDPINDLLAIGVRAQSKIHQFDYRAEWTREMQDTSGYQVDGEAGYTFGGSWQPRLAAEYFYASSGYNQLFPTAHKWLGSADVLGRRNIRGYAGHLTSPVLKWLNVQFDYQAFQRVDTARPAYKLNGTSALGSGSASDSAEIGHEVDFSAKMTVSQSVTFNFGAGKFFAGKYLRDQFEETSPNFYWAQMEMKF